LTGFNEFGDWVNGGVWGTVEGRAIMGYYRLNRTGDVFKSATRAMRWAKDFRMDAPFSQRGENTSNPWSDTGNFQVGGVAVMVDNFAIPAATVRGLFELIYRADRMILYPHIPQSITEYRQYEPVWFGDKQIRLSLLNGSGEIASVKVNGKAINVNAGDHFSLSYKALPSVADVQIVMEGTSTSQPPVAAASSVDEVHAGNIALPQSLVKPCAVLTKLNDLLKDEPNADFDRAFVKEALASIEAWRERSVMDPGPGYYRKITPDRRAKIDSFYEMTALRMYSGLAVRMDRYSSDEDQHKKRIVELFKQAGG
jgi:hypothetical protein